jgi:hypothetical protein
MAYNPAQWAQAIDNAMEFPQIDGVTAANYAASRSPRSQPRKARLSSSVSRRSVLARRCSRDTATLDAWMTWASMPRALSQ